MHCRWELVKFVDFATVKITILTLLLGQDLLVRFSNLIIQEIVQVSMLRLSNGEQCMTYNL